MFSWKPVRKISFLKWFPWSSPLLGDRKSIIFATRDNGPSAPARIFVFKQIVLSFCLIFTYSSLDLEKLFPPYFLSAAGSLRGWYLPVSYTHLRAHETV